MVSRRHIPRGCRTNYIPGHMEETQSIYEAYKKQHSSNPFAEGTLETGNKLIETMKEEKKKRWEEVITSIDLTHNSRKTWQTIKKKKNHHIFRMCVQFFYSVHNVYIIPVRVCIYTIHK